MSDDFEFDIEVLPDVIGSMTPDELAQYLDYIEIETSFLEAVQIFNEAVAEDCRERHDIPADVRINIERFVVLVNALTEVIYMCGERASLFEPDEEDA